MTILTAPNQLASHVTLIQAPVSPLYFLESPRAITQTIVISMPDVERSLHVDVAVEHAALEPGGSTSISIQISDPDGNYSSGDVEDCVIVVDRSILDLTPCPLPCIDRGGVYMSDMDGAIIDNAPVAMADMARGSAASGMGVPEMAGGGSSNVFTNEGLQVQEYRAFCLASIHIKWG
jgi:hypothetical protein